jgi:hypothetical protein
VSYAQHLADAPVHGLQVTPEVCAFLRCCRFDVGDLEGVVFIQFRLLAEVAPRLASPPSAVLSLCLELSSYYHHTKFQSFSNP